MPATRPGHRPPLPHVAGRSAYPLKNDLAPTDDSNMARSAGIDHPSPIFDWTSIADPYRNP
jgi:hypothetical protein